MLSVGGSVGRASLLQVRQREVSALSRLLWVKFSAIVVLFLAPTLISVLTFSLYMRLAERVRLDEVFAGLAFMNIIRLPMSALPQATSAFADLRVAMKRIDRQAQGALSRSLSVLAWHGS